MGGETEVGYLTGMYEDGEGISGCGYARVIRRHLVLSLR
jgi:hypothetical protein